MAGPNLPDYETLMQAGIDPFTRGPVKSVNVRDQKKLKRDLKQYLRIIDEQDAVNRYVWTNLPNNITSQELERLIYYKGQLAFFYMKDLDEFYFMPYALDGTIDFYGRFNTIHPVPMTSGEDSDKKTKSQIAREKTQADLLSNIKLKVVYGIKLEEDLEEEDLTNSTVLLHDYTKQMSQSTLPRSLLNDSLLDAMANMIPFMNTKLMLSTGIRGVRVNDADQSQEIDKQGYKVEDYALNGKPWIPFQATLEFQELALQSGGQAQDYLLALQALDNFRLSGYGIDNGGLFEKKAHELQSQADLNGGPVGLVLQDGLSIRQNFCNIVNSIWDLGIWCEISEELLGYDANGDMIPYEESTDGAGSGHSNEQPEEEGGEE